VVVEGKENYSFWKKILEENKFFLIFDEKRKKTKKRLFYLT